MVPAGVGVLVIAVGALALYGSMPDGTPRPYLVGDPGSRASTVRNAEAALAMWRDFPVAAEPRPLVVLDPTQFGGTVNESPRENGFMRGMWTLPRALPKTPATMAGYPIAPAGTSVERLRRAVVADMDELYEPAVAATMRSIRLERRQFLTDRGVMKLPAWVVRFEDFGGDDDETGGGDEEAAVIAVDPSRWFKLPSAAVAQGSFTVSADGRNLTYEFTGAGPGHGPCEAEYTPVFQESATAVAVGAIVHPGHLGWHVPGNSAIACLLLGYSRSVTVVLNRPLGNRVVVTYSDGAPVRESRAIGPGASRLNNR